MSTIQETAHKTSHELALVKGVFPNWEKSIYATKNVPMRNAALTNVAPTGTFLAEDEKVTVRQILTVSL